jgi:transcriptional/translational regulatory protein YebC/TACO1
LGQNGSVSYMFDKRGLIVFSNKETTEEKLMEIGLDAGAEDIVADKENIEVITKSENFEAVLKVFNDSNIPHISAEVTMIPNTMKTVQAEKVDKVLNLIDNLEELDDIQNVYTNLDIPDDYNVK